MNELLLRFATPDDSVVVFKLVQALAEYEKLANEVISGPDDFRKILQDPNSRVEVLLAEKEGEPIGFALFFQNFSTFLGKPGLFLEDLFVVPEHRKSGVGKALLQRLIELAKERNYGRVEWFVLDWNEPAIDFYTKKIGAELMTAWRVCRISVS